MTDTATRPSRRSRITDATRQLRVRRKLQRRRRVRRVLVALVLLALIGTGIWAVGFSSLLTADSVRVRGTEVLSADEVEQVAAVPVGTPMVRVDLPAVEARVGELAPIRDVAVERSWPHTVAITVTEREPVYALSQANSGVDLPYRLVDADGVAYIGVEKVPDGLLVAEVTGSDPAILADLALVADALPEKLAERVQKITAASPDSIQLELSKGVTVVWGSADQSELKAEVLTALMKQEADVYDVSAPANPATR
ncbi:MAG: cell division protein FtsQ/DivIB [Propionibacteriaceae bacterium]